MRIDQPKLQAAMKGRYAEAEMLAVIAGKLLRHQGFGFKAKYIGKSQRVNVDLAKFFPPLRSMNRVGPH